MASSETPTPYLPFMETPGGAFRWRLGVRPLDVADWIELGPGADGAIAAKAALNRDHPETVFAALDDTEVESQEVADALLGHLRQRWPDRYGTAELDADLHPLDAAARLVPEDLVLLVERDGALVFGGGSVCFPNRWDLQSKIGCSMADVHRPVALLNEQLEAPIDRFFERLTPERSFWRLGWGVIDTADWYTPLDGTAAPRPPAPAPADHYLRVERETLRRFPTTGCVLFTIRTHVAALPVVADDPRVAERLAAALESLPPEVQGYKDVVSVSSGIVEVLRSGSMMDRT
ncbi:MAG: DUF3445 domain-containing protein [Ilumatobacteraceae bacterium]